MAHTTDRPPQRPLYVFDLPEELLYTLRLRTEPTAAAAAAAAAPPPPPPPLHPASPSPPGVAPPPSANGSEQPSDGAGAKGAAATACGLCGLSFATLQEQRSHARSDLHGYNLKQKLRGKASLSEAEFERLIKDLDESISGSDSSGSEESGEDDDGDGASGGTRPRESTLSALLKRQAKVVDGDADDAPAAKRKRGSGKPPLLWFTSPKLPAHTSLGIYRAIFSTAEQEREEQLVESLQRRQLSAKPPPPVHRETRNHDDDQEEDGGVPLPASMRSSRPSVSGPHYLLCMIGGGHFAGMLVSLTPKLTKKNGVEDRSASVMAHKTFHRYTTRRKQGGAQSANDSAKGNAHSAGSSIRRHNEAALTQEVRDLLAEWRPWIDSADLLFIRASGSTNRRTLFGPYEGQVLNPRDDRLRGFPFSTRRATQSELMRSFVELTRAKLHTVDEAALAKQAEEAAAAAATAAAATNSTSTVTTAGAAPATNKSTLSKEDEVAALHTTQLQALIRRSKAPALIGYLTSNGLDANFRFHPASANHHAPTPLHLAAASNSAACVTSLLVKGGADPTVRNDEGKCAFEIAGERATRDAFRLGRAQVGEAKWDWDAAGVGAGLSPAEVEERNAREKREEEAEEERRRKGEMERLRREEEEEGKKEAKPGKGRSVGGVAQQQQQQKMTAEERRREEGRGMTEEMKRALERERRARAAEERMRALQGR